MTLLRYAAEHKPPLRGPLMGKVKRLRLPENSVVAYTPEQVGMLLAGAAEMKGYFLYTGIKKSDWWLADINGSWDLGSKRIDH